MNANLTPMEQLFYEALAKVGSDSVSDHARYTNFKSSLRGFLAFAVAQKAAFERAALGEADPSLARYESFQKAEELAEVIEELRSLVENRLSLENLQAKVLDSVQQDNPAFYHKITRGPRR